MENTQPILPSSERKKYRGLAMGMKPAVIVGRAGVTPPVLDAVEFALNKDQLIKLRIEAPDKATRLAWLETIANSTKSTVCGTVGHTASLFRAKPSTTNH